MKTFFAFVLFILVVSSYSAFAQSGAVISSAYGNGFSVISDGSRREFDAKRADAVGFPLNAGDAILTEAESYLEITLTNGRGNVVMLAENTMATIVDLESDGGGVFDLSYGRIRAKVGSLPKGSNLWITGYNTIVGGRNADFGYDLFYDRSNPGADYQTTTYSFKGNVDVYRYDKEVESKMDLLSGASFLLSRGKMMQGNSKTPTSKFFAVATDQAIIDYWAAYPNVVGNVVEAPPIEIAPAVVVEEAPAAPQVVQAPIVPVEVKPSVSENLNLAGLAKVRHSLEVGGKAAFFGGVLLMTVGGILKAALPTNDDISTASLILLGVGGVAGVVGGSLALYSFTLQ